MLSGAFQLPQHGQTRIALVLPAVALLHIPIRTALRAQALALWRTQGLGGQRQHKLLPQVPLHVEFQPCSALAQARRIFQELSHRVHAWAGDADIIVSPTVPGPPPRVGAWSELDGEAAFRAAADFGAFTAVFNLSGQPAASVPVGRAPEGFPIGVQVVGRGETVTLVGYRTRYAPNAAG